MLREREHVMRESRPQGLTEEMEIGHKAPENRPALDPVRADTGYMHTKGFTAFNPLSLTKSISQMRKEAKKGQSPARKLKG